MDKYCYEFFDGTIYKIPLYFLTLLEELTPPEVIFVRAWEAINVDYIDINYENIHYSVAYKDDSLNFAYFDIESWYLIPFFNHRFTFNNKFVEAYSFVEFHTKVKKMLKIRILE